MKLLDGNYYLSEKTLLQINSVVKKERKRVDFLVCYSEYISSNNSWISRETKQGQFEETFPKIKRVPFQNIRRIQSYLRGLPDAG